MKSENEFDMIVIGGGPGGYVAAIRGAQLGASVCLIEGHKLGGTCLNYGCIPTKALHKNAEVMNTMRKSNDFGISIDNISFDIEKVFSRKDDVVTNLVGGIEKLLEANGVEVIRGYGQLVDGHTVKVNLREEVDKSEDTDNVEHGERRHETVEVSGKNIIIATGSKPIVPTIPGIGSTKVYTSRELLTNGELPERLAVIGGGVIAVEFASIYNSLHSQVALFIRSNLLKALDKDVVKRYTTMLKKQGIDVNTSTKVTTLKETAQGIQVTFEDKTGIQQAEFDGVLLAIGREPNLTGLNLDGVGLKYDPKGIAVDQHFRTNVANIYAIGDVNGIVMLAHAASHQGITAVEHLMGENSEINHEVVPSCIFSFPEIASVGITEKEAKEKNMAIKTSKFMFGGNGKALAIGENEGFVKVIADQNDKIIGGQIIGPHASDLIHSIAIAISNNLNAHDIGKTIHAHPTLSEAVFESVMGLKNEAIHVMPAKRR